MVLLVQSAGISAKVVVIGLNGCTWGRWLYSGKVKVFEQKWLSSGKFVVFGQKGCI